MDFWRMFRVCLACLALCQSAACLNAADTLTVAFWNVENLFDTRIDGSHDKDFSPSSWRRWTQERYSRKLDNLAWAVNEIRPDVLCMAEVENCDVVEDLSERMLKKHGWTLPYIAHVDSPDPRGIDQAIMSVYPIRSSRLMAKSNRRRGILVATVDADGDPVTLFVNHWKSRIGDRDANVATRTTEAVDLREEVETRIERSPDTAVVITGDFNEDIDEPIMTQILGAGISREKTSAQVLERRKILENLRKYGEYAEEPGSSAMSADCEDTCTPLYNLMADAGGAGTYYYARRRMWNSFDSIIVSGEMLLDSSEEGPAWRALDPGATEVFSPPELREEGDGRPKAFRRVRIKGRPQNYYEDGYSDHFPVVTVLTNVSPRASEAVHE